MYEFNELTYAAIITLNTPANSKPLKVYVTLTPPDQLDLGDGETVKPLKDCTIAELQQFAAELEADVWAQYEQITLYDLAESDEGYVRIEVIREGEEKLEEGPQWLVKSGLVFPKTEPAAEAESPPEADPPAEEPAEAETEAVDPAADPAPLIPEVEEIPVFDAPPEEPTAETAESDQRQPSAEALLEEIVPHEPEEEKPFEITVLDTEPVYEEREAAEPREVDEITPPTAESVGLDKPKGRTAGERSRLNDPRPHACDVLIDEEPFRGSQAHALTSLNREVAGVLVGPHPEKQPDGRYVVHITDYIIAKHTRMHGASVTYTPESWRYVSDVMMSRYPAEEAVIVGWYHTHPGFGIFLSNMDLFIHHNFFTQKWHIALVLDPVGKRSGFFTWDRKQKEVMAYPFPWPYWAHRSW